MTPVANTRSDSVGWRSIDSAPKDGTTIILARFGWCVDTSDLNPDDMPSAEWRRRFTDENSPKVYKLWWVCGGHWSAKFSNWNDGFEPCGLASPTHWLPLPTPPALEERRG